MPCRIIYDTPDGRSHWFCRVKVVFGQPIPAAQLDLGEKRDMKKLRENKKLLVQRWEQLYEENKYPERGNA